MENTLDYITNRMGDVPAIVHVEPGYFIYLGEHSTYSENHHSRRNHIIRYSKSLRPY